MTRRGVFGFIMVVTGWILLTLALAGLALTFYYRPTLEYVYVDNRPQPMPSWLTGELAGGLVAAALGITGGLFLFAGRRWRRL